ncbi:LysR family transcriptional regulator [Paroceanicella profunda]|uniref:LysR family transcriptional regulator n=1 Tax=Paroceanicella profunda TaxID=2579971 RepID=A0A5B8FHH5_9RHOB|nr:LysR family transcriptional regulator [Paroceanicella profunda]QDL92421.1 LysR family transcriptional regulator [Paroceanicella profunda]
MKTLTLRQIEAVRAVMMTGTIAGAAKLLHVSAPGISRLIKHIESGLGIRLFEKQAGLFVPAAEAQAVFDQINEVYLKIEGLDFALDNLRKGRDAELAFGSVPSIAQFMVSRAVVGLRRKYPELFIDLNILKIEETVDYLLLGRGELVAMSYAFEHPLLEFVPLGAGVLVALVPQAHPLARQREVSVHDLVHEPIIGVDPADPYGAIMARPFVEAGLTLNQVIRARFAQTVVSLVRHGLGVTVIDEFSVAGQYMPGLTRIALREQTGIRAYAAVKKGRVLSSFADETIHQLRGVLTHATRNRPWEARHD